MEVSWAESVAPEKKVALTVLAWALAEAGAPPVEAILPAALAVSTWASPAAVVSLGAAGS